MGNALPHWSVGIWVLDLLRAEPGLTSIWLGCQAGLTWATDGSLRWGLFLYSSLLSQNPTTCSVPAVSAIFQKCPTGLHWAPRVQSRPLGVVSHSPAPASWASWLCLQGPLRALACMLPSVGNASPHLATSSELSFNNTFPSLRLPV